MTRLDRRLVLLGGTALALAACAPEERIADGADAPKKPPKGGIGGTGIVGTLTDFGSLVVNGLTVELSPETEITDAFGARAEDALFLGQSLTIEAQDRPEGLIAARVHVTHPVIGKVSDIASDARSARVAGVPVMLEERALGRFLPGQRMAVSGVWREDTVVASRLDPLGPQGPSVIAGEIGASSAGQRTIGGRLVIGPVETLPEVGTFVTAIGTAQPDGFVIEKLTPGRFTGAAGGLVALSVEGFLEPSSSDPGYALSGLGHSFDEFAQLRAASEDRALFRGVYDGSFVVEEALVLPQDFQDRRALLAAVRDGSRRGKVLGTRL